MKTRLYEVAKQRRIASVVCSTPSGYRWLRVHLRGAIIVPTGFEVFDEGAWSESLRCAEGRETSS